MVGLGGGQVLASVGGLSLCFAAPLAFDSVWGLCRVCYASLPVLQRNMLPMLGCVTTQRPPICGKSHHRSVGPGVLHFAARLTTQYAPHARMCYNSEASQMWQVPPSLRRAGSTMVKHVAGTQYWH